MLKNWLPFVGMMDHTYADWICGNFKWQGVELVYSETNAETFKEVFHNHPIFDILSKETLVRLVS